MTDWTSLDYVVVDVEGNGQHPADLVELAVVPIRGPAKVIVRTTNAPISPPSHIHVG